MLPNGLWVWRAVAPWPSALSLEAWARHIAPCGLAAATAASTAASIGEAAAASTARHLASCRSPMLRTGVRGVNWVPVTGVVTRSRARIGPDSGALVPGQGVPPAPAS